MAYFIQSQELLENDNSDYSALRDLNDRNKEYASNVKTRKPENKLNRKLANSRDSDSRQTGRNQRQLEPTNTFQREAYY
jgi:hypothetical protein